MAKAKKAVAAPIIVPETYSEANTLMEQLGQAQRDLAKKELRLASRVAKLTALIERTAGPLKASIKALEAQLQAYADANRADLLKVGGKHHDMPAGRIGWRLPPKSIDYKSGVKVEAIVKSILALKLRKKFLRLKLEPNKDAMLADEATALTVPGIRIKQVEAFYVEPKGATLADGAP